MLKVYSLEIRIHLYITVLMAIKKDYCNRRLCFNFSWVSCFFISNRQWFNHL